MHKISTRMGIGLGLITMLMMALVLLGILSMKNINEKMDEIIKQNNRQIWYANVINDSIHSIDEAMLTLIQTDNEVWNNFEYVKIMTARATYKDALEKLEELERSEAGRRLIDKLKAMIATARIHTNKVTNLKRNGRLRDAALAYFSQENRTNVSALHQICKELVSYEEAECGRRYSEAVKTYIAARRMFIAIASVLLLFTVFAALILTRSITRPIRKGVEIANRLADGDLEVRIEESNRKDEAGQLLAAMKNMVEQLRQMKDLEHQLRQSQKLETLGRLAGGIAHDFNNMLNVILGSAELIKIQPNMGKKTHDRCEAIEKAVARAAGFVRQLLAFSRRQMLELRNVDLHVVVADFEKMIRRMIGEHIEVTIHRSSDLPTVEVDIAQINQVLLNLAVNAREAMPEGGRLVMDVSCKKIDREYCVRHAEAQPGDYVVLSVADTGVGMGEEVMDNIFEPFFTTKENGTGLGLSVVYGIVRQHGGFCTVTSELGKGTTFEVFLPAFQSPSSHIAEVVPELQITRGDGTILVVEDDAELRKTACDLLIMLGYDVLTASDGREGVEIFEKYHGQIDMVLLDMVMPKMSGREAYEEMRKIKPTLPSLFVTGYRMSDDCNGLMSHDGIDAIQKPYSIESLSKKIKVLLERTSCKAA